MDKKDRIYRVIFQNQGDIIELYAKEVSQSNLYAFVEVAEIIFGERSQVVVDPANEKLKAEFSDVIRTFIPMHSIIRIDTVEKEGANRVRLGEAAKGNVQAFPMPFSSNKKD